MTVSRAIRNQAQTMKGGHGRARPGHAQQATAAPRQGQPVFGSVKQAAEKAEGAFRRNESGPR
ncbi:hypothetical protein BX257_1308 [Streptomyces sp. 3212.3]|nr:hypothetical protein BX257_1308 [Streptomyces sp. 3212.3]